MYGQLKRYLLVEFVVQVLVDLLGVAVLLQQATQHTNSAHPENFGWHTSLLGTPSLTCMGARDEIDCVLHSWKNPTVQGTPGDVSYKR